MSAGPEIEAYRAESEALLVFLRRLSAADWARPSRCPPFDLRLLVVHLIGQADGIARIVASGPVPGQPEKDKLTWWDYDIAEDQAETVQWVVGLAAAEPPGPLADRFAAATHAATTACETLLAGDPVLTTGAGRIKLSDYMATRVLETTIHAMDIRDAVHEGPTPTADGLDVTLGILSGRLGADPLALGFGGIEFVLASTGRASLDAAQAARLGPLADRFPLLA